MSDNHELRQFTTVDGRVVTIHPVSNYLIQKLAGAVESRLRQEGAPIDPPTYTVTPASGAVETFPHDEASLQTDEDRAAWAAHIAATEKLQRERERITTRLFLLRGLEIGDVPPEWSEDMGHLGIEVPKDPDDLKLEYIQTEVMRTPEDVIRATMAIMRLSAAGAPQEEIEAAEAAFRRSISRSRSAEDNPTSG